jgi:hypothetical protein
VHDRFGIGTSTVLVAGGLEPSADGLMVVNLAIEDDPDGVVFVRQRLVACRQIDNAQPTMAKRRVAIDKQAGIIRSTMGDDITHPDHAFAIIRMERLGRDDAGNSAHALALAGRAIEAVDPIVEFSCRLCRIAGGELLPRLVAWRFRRGSATGGSGCPARL